MPPPVLYVRPRTLVIEVASVGSPINTAPASQTQATSETLPWQFDFTQCLLPGEAIASFTSNLYDTTTGLNTPVSLSDAPTNPTADVIQQIVRGSALTGGHTYRLEAHATVTTNVKTWGGYLDLNVPF